MAKIKEELLEILDRLEKRQEITSKTLRDLLEEERAQESQTAFVTSAIPLTEEQKKSLVVNLGFIFGDNFRVENRVKKSVIAGIKIQIGPQIIDNTIAGQLEKLKTELKKIN